MFCHETRVGNEWAKDTCFGPGDAVSCIMYALCRSVERAAQAEWTSRELFCCKEGRLMICAAYCIVSAPQVVMSGQSNSKTHEAVDLCLASGPYNACQHG